MNDRGDRNWRRGTPYERGFYDLVFGLTMKGDALEMILSIADDLRDLVFVPCDPIVQEDPGCYAEGKQQ